MMVTFLGFSAVVSLACCSCSSFMFSTCILRLSFPGVLVFVLCGCFFLPLPTCIVAAKSKLSSNVSIDVFGVLGSCSSIFSVLFLLVLLRCLLLLLAFLISGRIFHLVPFCFLPVLIRGFEMNLVMGYSN